MCTCDIQLLMREGCRCGGDKKTEKSEKETRCCISTLKPGDRFRVATDIYVMLDFQVWQAALSGGIYRYTGFREKDYMLFISTLDEQVTKLGE